jgi:hypothetical protein
MTVVTVTVVIFYTAMLVLGLVLRGRSTNFMSTVQAQDNQTQDNSAQAEDSSTARDHHRCKERALKGSFGSRFEGHVVGVGPVVSVGVLIADGEGNVFGHDFASANGLIVNRTATGTYHVNPDCTGSVEATFHTGTPGKVSHIDFIIVDDGNKLFATISDPGTVINGVVERQ